MFVDLALMLVVSDSLSFSCDSPNFDWQLPRTHSRSDSDLEAVPRYKPGTQRWSRPWDLPPAHQCKPDITPGAAGAACPRVRLRALEAPWSAAQAPQSGRVYPDVSGPGTLHQLCRYELLGRTGGETMGWTDPGPSGDPWDANKVGLHVGWVEKQSWQPGNYLKVELGGRSNSHVLLFLLTEMTDLFIPLSPLNSW